MLGSEEEYLLKDIFIIICALFGIIILIFIQIKNSGLKVKFLKKKKKLKKELLLNENKNSLTYSKNWTYYKDGYSINMEDFFIWNINLFNCYKINKHSRLEKIKGHFWYKFSNCKEKTDKIMIPIFRKVINKYRNQVGSEKSIHFIAKNHNHNSYLYTWLRNESHIHTVIYTFLDECIYIANQLKLKVDILLTLDHFVAIEVLIPFEESILLFEKELKEIYAVEFSLDKKLIRIKLWLAFSAEEVPTACLENYSKANIKLLA